MFVYANTGNFIHIGRAGENLATQVIFDISEFKYIETSFSNLAPGDAIRFMIFSLTLLSASTSLL